MLVGRIRIRTASFIYFMPPSSWYGVWALTSIATTLDAAADLSVPSAAAVAMNEPRRAQMSFRCRQCRCVVQPRQEQHHCPLVRRCDTRYIFDDDVDGTVNRFTYWAVSGSKLEPIASAISATCSLWVCMVPSSSWLATQSPGYFNSVTFGVCPFMLWDAELHQPTGVSHFESRAAGVELS